jgi:hypothetical protein
MPMTSRSAANTPRRARFAGSRPGGSRSMGWILVSSATGGRALCVRPHPEAGTNDRWRRPAAMCVDLVDASR